MRTKDSTVVSVRVRFNEESRLGPGKIALLEAIARTGSISAAGREMGMSYRRAWLLIDSLNRMFVEPIVVAASGGASGGGATLTALGHELVNAYRAMEAEAIASVQRHIGPLHARMIEQPGPIDPRPYAGDPDDPVDSPTRRPGEPGDSSR